MNDAFLSIVSKDCARDELLVRARRKGDIEKIFPSAKVVRTPKGDYLFRAVIKRTEIAAALDGEVRRITYGNFKDSVKDDALHNAYLRVWTAMASVQPAAPWGAGRSLFSDGGVDWPHPIDAAKPKQHIRGRKSRSRRSAKVGVKGQ